MRVLITYDVSTVDAAGRRRLRHVARACQDHGVRVQLSVFECDLEPAAWTSLRARLISLIDPSRDSLRFYRLGASARAKVEHIGAAAPLDLDDTLIL